MTSSKLHHVPNAPSRNAIVLGGGYSSGILTLGDTNKQSVPVICQALFHSLQLPVCKMDEYLPISPLLWTLERIPSPILTCSDLLGFCSVRFSFSALFFFFLTLRPNIGHFSPQHSTSQHSTHHTLVCFSLQGPPMPLAHVSHHELQEPTTSTWRAVVK